MRKMFFLILFTVHISCVPQLKTQEIKLLLKKDLTSVSERNVEYLIDNIPKKYWKTNDKELVKKKLENLLKDNETKVYGEIDDIHISNPCSCNSFKFYNVNFNVLQAEFSNYVDDSVLDFNYKEFGENNVNYDPNTKILTIYRTIEKVIIFDKDRKWKVLNNDSEFLDNNFGSGFYNCMKSIEKRQIN